LALKKDIKPFFLAYKEIALAKSIRSGKKCE